MDKCTIEKCVICNSDMETLFDDFYIAKSCTCRMFSFTTDHGKLTQIHICFDKNVIDNHIIDLYMSRLECFYYVYKDAGNNTATLIKTVDFIKCIDKLSLNQDLKLQCEYLLKKLIKIGEIYG